MDLAALNEMDPSLEGGFKIQFDREIQIELRLQDSNQANSDAVGTLEAIRVKLLTLGDQQNLQILKIELTSESDLFFNYISMLCSRGVKHLLEWMKNSSSESRLSRISPLNSASF